MFIRWNKNGSINSSIFCSLPRVKIIRKMLILYINGGVVLQIF